MNEMNEETTCDIRVGHAIELLRGIPDGTIDLVVTSPPYWGLRDYKTDPVVFGGDRACSHEWKNPDSDHAAVCDCGAWKGQLGLEQTPEEFIDHLVEIFDECNRVLKPTGNLWVNLGDSYMRKGSYTPPENYGLQKHRDEANHFRPTTIPPGYKEKDLVGIPWTFAFAARKAGWYLRNDIVWAKSISGPHYRGGVCMPEPVRDRCTRSHEFFFHLTKESRYYYDIEATVEPLVDATIEDGRPERGTRGTTDEYGRAIDGNCGFDTSLGRNMRTVWHFNPQPFPGAHFAVFPKHLIEPIVKASTSEHGCCGKCGAPWSRITKKMWRNPSDREQAPQSEHAEDETGWTQQGKQRAINDGDFPTGVYHETTGWQPTCECHGKFIREEVIIPPRGSEGVDWRAAAEARDGIIDRGAAGNTGLDEWSKRVKDTQDAWGADSTGGYVGVESKYDDREEHGGRDVKGRIIDGLTKPKKKYINRYESDLPLDKHPVVPAVVLDPFSGSGTSGIVALDEGRSYIGLELSPEYAAMSLRRLKQERTGLTTKRFREAAPELKEYW